MKLIETKGDVRFYEDEKERMFQQIGEGEVFKVKNGQMAYEEVKQVNNYSIKYDLHGVYGFSVCQGKKILEDNIWTLAEAEQIANELT